MLEPRLRELLCAVRDYARQEGMQAELLLHRERSSLIRLCNSAVALSTSEELTRVDINVYDGRHTGGFSLTGDLTSFEQLRDALRRAQEYCTASPEKDYQPIFGAVEADIDDTHDDDPQLDALAPQAKTALCAEVIHALAPQGDYNFSGAWSTGAAEYYLLTSANDREAYRQITDGKLMLVLQERQRKWELSAEQCGKGVDAFSAERMIEEFSGLLPIYTQHGGYRAPLGPSRVIFGPQAIAELINLAVSCGFFGRGWEEQRAFTSPHRFGDVIFSSQISLHDDPTHPNVTGMPFDLKGRGRKPFSLVSQGVFNGLMYDAATAGQYGKHPTGHDLESGDFVLSTGNAPAGLEAGIALAQDALYIPHLHYTHMPNPAQGMITGSSRFNALRVEDGAFTAPLFSTRITDTIPNIFNHVVAVAEHAVPVDVSNSYGRRTPFTVSAPDYLICDNVRISDVAESF